MSSARARNLQPSGSQLESEDHKCSDHLENYENYDVFLSHRGLDTKKGVVRELHEAFKRAGLRAFLDCDSIGLGQSSWGYIEHAIQKTPIALVIFSKNFAESPWCLKELHLILKTPNVQLIPIFYKVKQWEVARPGAGSLRRGFKKLKRQWHAGRFDQS